MLIRAEPLSALAYAPFGEILSADREDVADRPANQGTARRRDFLLESRSLRPDARANFASFRCAPRTSWPFPLALLEKHPASTQLFIPMNATRYLVVVALGAAEPDLSTVRAFMAGPTQAISYYPGTWHHPLLALDAVTDFACLVWEDGSAEDCVTAELAQSGLLVEIA